MTDTTCGECHFWRTRRFSAGETPGKGCNLAMCTALDSVHYEGNVSRDSSDCPAWYDNSIELTFLQNEGMEQGFSPGTSSLEVLVAEHPEEEEGVMVSFAYADNRAAATMARINLQQEGNK